MKEKEELKVLMEELKKKELLVAYCCCGTKKRVALIADRLGIYSIGTFCVPML